MFRLVFFIIFICLTSCSKYQNISQNKTHTPKTWNTQIDSTNVQNSNHTYSRLWWQYFNDVKLKKIIQSAIDSNLDYKIALARIEHAKASTGLSKAVLYPDISMQENVQTSKNTNIFVSNKTKILRSDNVNLNASWEIDLFGQNRNAALSSRALLESTVNRANYLLISIVAETINSYLEYKATAKSLDLVRKIGSAEKTKLKLITDRMTQGITNEIEVNEQNSMLLSNKVLAQTLSHNLQQLEYKIETLCNKPPGTLRLALQGTDMPSFNQKILIHSPIKVIAQRPDVLAAKYSLMSSTSITKSTLAKQFPSINIQAAFGYQKSDLSSSSTAWSLTQGLILPLINFGRIKSEIDMNRASEKEAFLEYQKNIYTALEDVEAALSYYKYSFDNYKNSQTIVASKQKNLKLTQSKYSSKVTDYTDVLESQKALHHAEIEQYKNLAHFNQSLVRLSKSLGYKVI